MHGKMIKKAWLGAGILLLVAFFVSLPWMWRYYIYYWAGFEGQLHGRLLRVYGRVIDQNGDPVPNCQLDATMTYYSVLHGWESQERKSHIVSDSSGAFFFSSGAHMGTAVIIRPKFGGQSQDGGYTFGNSSYFIGTVINDRQHPLRVRIVKRPKGHRLISWRKSIMYDPSGRALDLYINILSGRLQQTPFSSAQLHVRYTGWRTLDKEFIDSAGRAAIDALRRRKHWEVDMKKPYSPEDLDNYFYEVNALSGCGVRTSETFMTESWRTYGEVPTNGFSKQCLEPSEYQTIYFYTNERKVYGVMLLRAGYGNNYIAGVRQVELSVRIIANPRGSPDIVRLEGAKDLPLPVELPFHEPVSE